MNHISKSSLMARAECPFSWHCDRDLKLPGRESLGAIVGGAFHEVQKGYQEMRMLFMREPPPLKWCEDVAATIYNEKVSGAAEALIATEQQVNEGRTDLLRLVAAFHPYAERIKPVAVEQEFEIVIPGTDWTVYGFIDLIEALQGKVDVVSDYKTTGSSPYKDDPKDTNGTEERRIGYVNEVLWNPEVAAYVLGYRVLYKKQEAEFRYYNAIKTKTAKIMPVSVKVTDKQITWFLQLVFDMIKDLENGIHVRRPSCMWCSPSGCAYWNYCHGIEEVVPSGPGKFTVV